MNEREFDSLDDIEKMDYVLACLYKAHSLFKVIYDSGCCFLLCVLDELEYLVYEFSRIVFIVEIQDYTDVYTDLNKNLSRLSSIVAVIEEYIYKNRTVN